MTALIRHLVARSLVLVADVAASQTMNCFDVSDTAVPSELIHAGGPARDDIPALDRPQNFTAAEASYVRPDERILGVSRSGIHRAYPIQTLNYHGIVNDAFAGEAIAVTFRPLCGTGIGFL